MWPGTSGTPASPGNGLAMSTLRPTQTCWAAFYPDPQLTVCTSQFGKYGDKEEPVFNYIWRKSFCFQLPFTHLDINQRQSLSLVLIHLQHLPNTCKSPFQQRAQPKSSKVSSELPVILFTPLLFIFRIFFSVWEVIGFSICDSLDFTLIYVRGKSGIKQNYDAYYSVDGMRG